MKNYIILGIVTLKSLSIYGDVFWIFNVGQGNCQLAIFEEECVGFLYDCGSISLKSFSKITNLTTGDYKIFFHRKDEKLALSENVSKAAPLDTVNNEMANKDFNSDSSFSQETKGEDIEFDLASILKDLKHLFIILSHPDSDHINLINADNIPDNISITVLCEGNWFGQKNTNEDGLTESVCDVLKFLKARENSWIVFPFYWGGLQCLDRTIPYEEIFKEFQDDKSEDLKGIFKLCQQGSIVAFPVYHDMYDVLLKIGAHLFPHFKSFRDVLACDDYSYVNSPYFCILKNIKIAHINFPFKDVNSH